MRRTLKSVLWVGSSIFAAAVLFQCGYIGLRVSEALTLAQDSRAFQLLQPDAAAQILVVGDDTAVGTGAALPSASVAGQIAQRYPCISVVNRARDGVTVRDVAAQIEGTGDTHFDLLLVQAGANDVLQFAGNDALAGAATAMLRQAGARADHVVFMDSSQLENRWLLPPLGGWYERRAREMARVLSQTARTAGVEYVDARSFDETGQSAKTGLLPGRLHPDDDTYARWFRLLMRESRIASILQC